MPNRPRVGSLPSVRRLPSYLHLLRELDGVESVSSTYIASKLRLDSIQVRKDLAITGVLGKPKVGYPVKALILSIEAYLGWDNAAEAFLAGAGNLGSALLGYDGFARHGLSIIAAFDANPDIVGRTINGKQVLHIDRLPGLAKRMHVRMGIIAVTAPAAQRVADLMTQAGIRAIWNFAPVSLSVPEDVVVQDEDLASGFAVLSVKAAKWR